MGALEYEAFLRQALARGDASVLERREPVTEAPTFTEFSARWLASYATANNKESEVRTKRLLLRRHVVPWFGAKRLDAIRTSDIEEYKAVKRASGLSSKTINNQLAVLGKALRTARDWEVVANVPTIKLLRYTPPAIRYLRPDEIAALLGDRHDIFWTDLVCVALGTGMRRGELAALHGEDVDFASNHITVRRRLYRNVVSTPKSHRVRQIPMTHAVRRVLLQRIHAEGPVFTRDGGGYLPECAMGKALHRLCARVDVSRTGWHIFRHTFATELVARGVPVPVVMQLLGHASIAMTMRYAHVARSSLDDAIRALDGPRVAHEGQPVGNTPPLARRPLVPFV